jgi:hypothetical protein
LTFYFAVNIFACIDLVLKIDSFVQLPETESDCHQSDHVMEFHLDSDSKSHISSDVDGSFQEQKIIAIFMVK